ncbi:CAMK family protein kinase [Trichomonas vaginalis G3]|uniref:CAMK family protein kinase n=1 Tax=Trichomonas vaginalis (strain ATCC PRA-98 / G3) TaxID=412133 RepID=A2DG38_TRIV3|nr:protein serine/threonine kinase protein [Trichomonas vaginalis G3]EAY20665.1 CAMK family protein kinase [Trichomonas vaginalis G3]KAI5487386.1 protein serine/threonine kinase protein [Trichomonas vaginalis G3]|eukprot:XP_001581651.1 CAMK family protein kinase [Trichomonas vaginalis G3]
MDELTIDNIEGRVIDGFEIREQIGKGASSSVRIARHIRTNNFCAVKIIDLHAQRKSAFNGIIREISVFMQVSHPHLAKLFRLSQVGNLLFFFMEYASGGTLYQYVMSRKGLSEQEALRIFSQLFDVFNYLQTNFFIAHRDIKMENILIDNNLNVKVIDFGLSDTFYCHKLTGVVGTPGYTAPEVIGCNEYNEKCDVFSLGVTLYASLTMSMPFTLQQKDARLLIEEATNIARLSGISLDLQNLLDIMLQPRPQLRASFAQIASHPWLRNTGKKSYNCAPRPIVYYKVENYSDCLKFKRNPEKIDTDIISQCETYGISKELLEKELENGEINDDTTIYFVLKNPLQNLPALPTVLPPLKKKKTPKPLHLENLAKFKSLATLQITHRRSIVPGKRMLRPLHT